MKLCLTLWFLKFLNTVTANVMQEEESNPCYLKKSRFSMYSSSHIRKKNPDLVRIRNRCMNVSSIRNHSNTRQFFEHNNMMCSEIN